MFSVRCFPLLLWLAFLAPAFGAERFNDVLVTAHSVASGETHHGYRELRVLVENLSGKATHRVTLLYPDRSYSHGHSISRLSRTVSLGPGSRALVPLWQPPLPVNGNGTLRVVIDDEEVGTVSLPDALRHMTRGARGYGASSPATLLVSRSLGFDELGRVLKPNSGPGAFSADAATGAPDSRPHSPIVPTAWMPDPSRPMPHWIELTYATPRPADQVRVHATMPLPAGVSISLRSGSGTNLGLVTVTGGSGSPTVHRFSFTPTTEPVASVRMEFGSAYGGSIGIDAVELIGPGGSEWAFDANASSDASGVYGGSVTPETLELIRSELAAAEWSESWLSYTPYDGIALSAADLRAMSPATVEALWRYAECGGNLVLLGGGEVPEPWRSFARRPLERGHRCQVGFGHCFVLRDTAPSALDLSAVKNVTEALGTSARFWQGLPLESEANSIFPVIENYKVPVRSTVMVMLLFVIVIGPVNVIVLARMNRRTWLLWTIPAISFVSCLMVFVFSLVREGVTPTVRIEGVTILDQINRRATTVGAEAFYCPLTPSRGLSLGSDTEASPLVAAFGRGSSGTQREVDWTQAQQFGRGWVTARVPAHFQVRKTETRRERLQVENTDGRLSVVNGLGASIRSLWLAQPDGRIYFAHNVAAGQKADLTVRPEYPVVGGASVHFLLANVRFGPMLSLITDAPSYLSAGTYIAELDANPFLENALGTKPGAVHLRQSGVVYGILEPSRQP